MKKVKELIWRKLADDRATESRNPRFTDTKFLERVASEKGVDSLKKLMNNDKLFHQALSYGMVIPEYLIDFIDLFIDESDKIYDPWVTRDSYIVRKNSNGHGYYTTDAEIDLINFIRPAPNFFLKKGDALLSNDDVSDIDAVISFPPFRGRNIENRRVGSGDFAIDLLIKCCNEFHKDGIVMMLCSGRIAFDRQIKQSLKRNKIGIKALFHLPAGAHLPNTAISSYLTLVQKEYRDKTFVAELSESCESNQRIFSNFQKFKPGKQTELGTLLDYASFNSFESLIKKEELLRKGRITGYPPVSFKDIVSSSGVSSMRDEESALNNHNSNCIYIPRIGNSRCVTHPSDLKPNVRNCLRVELTEKVVVPEYLVRFLNTPLGQLSLDSCKRGTAAQSLSSQSLLDALLFIPKYQDQIKAVSIDNQINSYINEFKELKEKLWLKPKEGLLIEEKLNALEDLNSVERWFDGIPFPLSSILWKYHATNRAKEKYEHLLHFFEALPEFLSMLYLSSFIQNEGFYKEESGAWVKDDPVYRDWYKRTDFGGWNSLYASLAKATRRLLGDNEKRNLTLTLLGQPNSTFLNFLTSKSVFNILDTVRQYRNDWKGHGGISGPQENQNRLTLLEEKLGDLRKIVKDSFSTCLIIVPGTSSFEDGVFKYSVKVLVGNRTPFNEIEVETIQPMDVNKLYLLHEGQITPIELLPFIKYYHESKACYFYNKIESGNTRWVSFHYEETSEVKEPLDEKFEEVLSVFRRHE